MNTFRIVESMINNKGMGYEVKWMCREFSTCSPLPS